MKKRSHITYMIGKHLKKFISLTEDTTSKAEILFGFFSKALIFMIIYTYLDSFLFCNLFNVQHKWKKD